jgi:hypothetical protein
MRALAIIPALFIPIFAAIGSCAQNMQAQSASAQASGNDCAVIAAISKEHYEFNTHPAPPLKGLGDAGWRPHCDWTKYGLSFTDYNDVPASADPRERLKYVEFQKPEYDGSGATVKTSIMHGPLAGMGYECRVRSGVAGWTVSECKTAWVS